MDLLNKIFNYVLIFIIVAFVVYMIYVVIEVAIRMAGDNEKKKDLYLFIAMLIFFFIYLFYQDNRTDDYEEIENQVDIIMNAHDKMYDKLSEMSVEIDTGTSYETYTIDATGYVEKELGNIYSATEELNSLLNR